MTDAADDGTGRILDKQDPLATARRFLRENFTTAEGLPTLLYTADEVFYTWNGVAYAEQPVAPLHSRIRLWLEQFEREARRPDGDTYRDRFKPNKRDVSEVLAALADLTTVELVPPAWLGDGDMSLPDPSQLIVAPNGVFDLHDESGRPLMPPTPRLFTTNALSYPVDAAAAKPLTWLRFLDVLFPDDRESIELLQEWFGYLLTGDTRQQKILMLIGPRRSGKGTIARVLRRLIGEQNMCGPTLCSLGQNFGLWPLVGKLLAVISDARLSGRTDQAIIIERLLSISGEDAITVDRKNKPQMTARLPTRIMVLTNELPRLADSSGALAGRLLVLKLTESFYGKEDVTLEDRLLEELPGILQWSIRGWRRLRERGRFLQPSTGQAAIDELHDLASPVGAFISDWCHVDPRVSVLVADLYRAWEAWCKEQGRDQPGTAQVFGRDLAAAVAAVATRQVRRDGRRVREFIGIDLTSEAKANIARAGTIGSAATPSWADVI